MNCCNHACDEGRACPARAPLYQADGGHYFNEGLAWPIEADEPIETAESAQDKAYAAGAISVVLLVLSFGAAVALYFN